MTKRRLNGRLTWTGLATVVAAAMLVPAALADKPAPKSKPIAAEKTWVKVGGGKGLGTSVLLNGALSGLEIVATPLAPATNPNDTPDLGVRFPITQGKLVLTKTGTPQVVTGVRGTVGHVGGLSLKKGDVTVRVRNLVIVADVAGTTDNSKLTAQVNGKRIDLATLKLTMPPTTGDARVTVVVTEVKLTAAAAAALTQAFTGTTVPEAVISTSAQMKARLVGKGKA